MLVRDSAMRLPKQGSASGEHMVAKTDRIKGPAKEDTETSLQLEFTLLMCQPQKVKKVGRNSKPSNLPHIPALSGSGSEWGKPERIPFPPLQRSEIFNECIWGSRKGSSGLTKEGPNTPHY